MKELLNSRRVNRQNLEQLLEKELVRIFELDNCLGAPSNDFCAETQCACLSALVAYGMCLCYIAMQ